MRAFFLPLGRVYLELFLYSEVYLQIEIGHGKKAIAIFVPVPLLPGFHKIQQRYDSPLDNKTRFSKQEKRQMDGANKYIPSY